MDSFWLPMTLAPGVDILDRATRIVATQIVIKNFELLGVGERRLVSGDWMWMWMVGKVRNGRHKVRWR